MSDLSTINILAPRKEYNYDLVDNLRITDTGVQKILENNLDSRNSSLLSLQ
jgi:hypothetical protein